MTLMESQKEFDRTRYFELKKQLEEASRLYYKDGVSPMSDQDFDFGLKEMEALEAKYPELRGKDSLTQRVGSDLTNDFAKVAHAVPMLSIANVYSEEEMREFVTAAEEGINFLDDRRKTKEKKKHLYPLSSTSEAIFRLNTNGFASARLTAFRFRLFMKMVV